jgi:non-heme chloroperoxidase
MTPSRHRSLARGNAFTQNRADLQLKIDALAKTPEDTMLMNQLKAVLPQFEENLNRKVNSIENPLPPPYSPPSAADKANFTAMTQRLSLAVGGIPPEAEPHESFLAKPDGSVGAPNATPDLISAKPLNPMARRATSQRSGRVTEGG